jgi:hypothetical protein
MRDSIPGWITGRNGWVLPWLTLVVVLASTLVLDRHWEGAREAERAEAGRRAEAQSVALSEALGNTISARVGALAAPRMRFTPIEDAVSERTFAAALDSVTLTLQGLAAVSAATVTGRITRGTGALFGRVGLSPDFDTIVGNPVARAVGSRAPAATGVVERYGTRRVL